jgi:hypothetical protein
MNNKTLLPACPARTSEKSGFLFTFNDASLLLLLLLLLFLLPVKWLRTFSLQKFYETIEGCPSDERWKFRKPS